MKHTFWVLRMGGGRCTLTDCGPTVAQESRFRQIIAGHENDLDGDVLVVKSPS